MAAASNFVLGKRDFQRASLRTLSSSASASFAIDGSTFRLLTTGFRFKSCYSGNYGSALGNINIFNSTNFTSDRAIGNGVRKARVYSPCVQEPVKAEDQQKSLISTGVNGSGAANRGKFARALEPPFQEKVMVAVDVDEVLGNFVSALNQFITDRYALNHSVSDYHVYEFFKIWNCSPGEADSRVHEFFSTHYFKKGIYPIPGALEALQKLSTIYNLSIVTSRQNAIKEHTIEWIETHYPGLFKEIHFGNHFALVGQSTPKSEICRSLGAKVLIDDNPRYAIECAKVGIKVLLFDYEYSYPWCKLEGVFQHPLVTKVHNWEEIEHQLASWVVS